MHSRKKRRGHRSAPFEREREDMFAGPSQGHNKTIRLCRQIERAISYALACSMSPLLREIYVASVEPLGGASSLRVTVTIEGDEHTIDEAEDALARANGYVRSEVAREINRKRVPTLAFHVVPLPNSTDGIDADTESADGE